MYAIENYASQQGAQMQMQEFQKEMALRQAELNIKKELPNHGQHTDDVLAAKGINPDPYDFHQAKEAKKEELNAPKVSDEQKDTLRMTAVGTEELQTAEETAQTYIEMIEGLDAEDSSDTSNDSQTTPANFYKNMADKYRMNEMVDTLGYQQSQQTPQQRDLTEQFVRIQPVYEQQAISIQV
ncbi:hypothetical protein HR060_02425 [Catenovulum sp. SM1970]|uniref:hypothetical protein n=1 Tax=Marinifaba aquimaris TaxID=2741323 RepID=UPI0015736F18|nr:hypothetical protein [Marinifaba aquimaris]NTS75711.1 hypothetical protein [Marinifaba aquimaris]